MSNCLFIIEAITASGTVRTEFCGDDIVRVTCVKAYDAENKTDKVNTGAVALRGDTTQLEFMANVTTRRYGKVDIEHYSSDAFKDTVEWTTSLDTAFQWYSAALWSRIK